jgi:hypothetical protein
VAEDWGLGGLRRASLRKDARGSSDKPSDGLMAEIRLSLPNNDISRPAC